jgi:hypothetical protein
MEYVRPDYQSLYREMLSWETHGAESEEDFLFLISFEDMFCVYSTFLFSFAILLLFIILINEKCISQ